MGTMFLPLSLFCLLSVLTPPLQGRSTCISGQGPFLNTETRWDITVDG